MLKYPRTPHLTGSKIQPGDDPAEYGAHHLFGRPVVIEEKLDGANAGISFEKDGAMRLQSRGHFLTGGHRERHFALFKSWANCHQRAFHEALGWRYQLYGEWLYAKHTIFYDRLPHYFMEFDVLDRETGQFLDTPSRQKLLAGLPISSVPVLHQGAAPADLNPLIRPSLYKSPQSREWLARAAEEINLDPERAHQETDPSPLAEGLYIKVEEQGQVTERYKYIRASFLTQVQDSESHWLDRPILPNRLAHGVDIFQC